MNILEISKLNKRFGKLTVINDMDLAVPENSVFGFVGQNGAGKTTTMKMALGLLNPTSGNISVCGEKVIFGGSKTNRYIGYLPDVPEFYGYMKPREYLTLCGEIAGLSRGRIAERCKELLSLVGLADVNRNIGGFSRGMKQRLGIAQALINEPRLLICDEPTSALDPIGRKVILDILAQIKGKTTVIFSTHILSDVERICDRIAVLHKGKIVLNGTLQDVKSQHRHNSFEIVFETNADAAFFTDSSELKIPTVELTHNGSSIIVKFMETGHNGHILVELLAQKRLTPIKFEVMEPTLETLFLEAVQ